ncbi:MAG: SDR family NAD(P)-dependent oxidoreductase, partial [Spirochaetales bacterium]
MAEDKKRSVFAGRRALVIGGSGGIGASISMGLASRGASLLVHGLTSSKVDKMVRSIEKTGGKAQGFARDIDGLSSILSALEPFGDFDILVVAFGPFVRKPFATHTPADWEKVAMLDLALPGALASRYFPAMCDNAFGRILFLGGTRTDIIRGFTSNAAYAAAKTGLGVLAKSIAIEGAPHNVAAVTICPGLVRTEYIGPEEALVLSRMAPGRVLSDPADIAAIALGLLDGDPC